jgi:hypothetical protein
MNEEKRKLIKDYLTICLMILYLITSMVGMFYPRANDLKPMIKEDLELLKE